MSAGRGPAVFDAYYLELFARVLAICLVLTGIHGYLGIHVLSRQVIFVDLAMAQIAALGATYALLLGFDPGRHPEDALPAYLFSLAFTLAGAAVFALTRMRHERVPQEAIIGIVYASASAIAILMLAKSPTAGEHIQHMLVGNILLVGWPTVASTAAIYSLIGLFHWLFRATFLQITLDPAAAQREGRRIRLWDFLFYATFGVVITSSVAIAGVLLVFSFLVVPAAVGVLFADAVGRRIAIGWAVGTLVSVVGILASFWADVPSSPAVVASFAAVLLAAGLLRFVAQAPSAVAALAKVAAGATVVAAGFYGTTALRKPPVVHEHHSEFAAIAAALASGDESHVIDALHHAQESHDRHLLPHVLHVLEHNTSERVIEHAVRAVSAFRDPAAIPILERVAGRDLDPFLRIEIARALLGARSPTGIPILLGILEQEDGALPRTQAMQALTEFTGKTFGYDAARSRADNAAAIAAWRGYWDEHATHMRWHEGSRLFK